MTKPALTGMSDMPDEILVHVLAGVDRDDLPNASLVNRRWCNCAREKQVWEAVVGHSLGSGIQCPAPLCVDKEVSLVGRRLVSLPELKGLGASSAAWKRSLQIEQGWLGRKSFLVGITFLCFFGHQVVEGSVIHLFWKLGTHVTRWLSTVTGWGFLNGWIVKVPALISRLCTTSVYQVLPACIVWVMYDGTDSAFGKQSQASVPVILSIAGCVTYCVVMDMVAAANFASFGQYYQKMNTLFWMGAIALPVGLGTRVAICVWWGQPVVSHLNNRLQSLSTSLKQNGPSGLRSSDLRFLAKCHDGSTDLPNKEMLTRALIIKELQQEPTISQSSASQLDTLFQIWYPPPARGG